MRSFFVDSCIFMEAFKKQGLEEAKQLYTLIFKDFDNEHFVGEVVLDEVFFYFIKNRQKFPSVSIADFSKLFEFSTLAVFQRSLISLWVDMLEKHNLKTHDAFSGNV